MAHVDAADEARTAGEPDDAEALGAAWDRMQALDAVANAEEIAVASIAHSLRVTESRARVLLGHAQQVAQLTAGFSIYGTWTAEQGDVAAVHSEDVLEPPAVRERLGIAVAVEQVLGTRARLERRVDPRRGHVMM